MQIKELRFNIQFEYIRDIRRYVYDLEEFLRQNNLCDKLNAVPPVPDDVEPHMERLNSMKENDTKILNIFVSQASASILFTYKVSASFDDMFHKEVDYISSVAQKIKGFFISKYPNFKINYEGLVMASSKHILKDDDIAIPKYNIDLKTEEDRSRIAKEIDDKHIEIIEKSFVKFYNNTRPAINLMAVKNKKETLIGWNYILVIEVHNRLQYNNSKDDNTSLELDVDFASNKIVDIFKKETK